MDNIKWTKKKEYVNLKRRNIGLIIVEILRDMGIRAYISGEKPINYV